MSNKTIATSITLLSDDQLETVAGGAAVNAIDLSAFEKLTEARVVQTGASGQGAFTNSASLRDFTKSLGLSELKVAS